MSRLLIMHIRNIGEAQMSERVVEAGASPFEKFQVGDSMTRLVRDIVAQERERCAKIADQFARANEMLNTGEEAAGAIAAAKAIAKEIRGGCSDKNG